MAICRWITIGYGLLVVLGLIVFGLLVRHINVPITDPSTGITTVQTFDIGAAFAIAAIFVAGLFALFAWLTRYTVARVIFLILDALAVLSALSALGRTQGFGAARAGEPGSRRRLRRRAGHVAAAPRAAGVRLSRRPPTGRLSAPAARRSAILGLWTSSTAATPCSRPCAPAGARKLVIAAGIAAEERLDEILRVADERGIPVEESSRKRLDDIAHTEHHQGIAGYFHGRPPLALDDLLAAVARTRS